MAKKKNNQLLICLLILGMIGVAAYFFLQLKSKTEHFNNSDDTDDEQLKCSYYTKAAEQFGRALGFDTSENKIWCSGSGGFCNTCPETHRDKRSGSGQFYYGPPNNKDNSIKCQYLNDRKFFEENRGCSSGGVNIA